MWRPCPAVFALLALVFSSQSAQIAARPAAADVDSAPGSVFQPSGASAPLAAGTEEYYKWLYRWHRGGAFLFHDSVHPCHVANQSCSMATSKDLRRDILRVNTTIVRQMEFVQLQYDLGDDDARDGDFIGVFCVDAQENPSQRVDDGDFFDYVAINATQEGSFRGAATVGPLANMRCSYQFRYLRRVGELEYLCISESPHIEMERGPSEPTQVHLALTATPGEMRVTWTSGRGAHQHAHYGVQPTNLTHHAEATTATYAASDLCSEPATIEATRWFRHPGYLHEAVMAGLKPGETYYYTVGSKHGVVSPAMPFTYPPLPGSRPTNEATRQSFFVFGDLGQGVSEALPAGAAAERRFAPLRFESRPSATSNKTVMKRIEQDLAGDTAGAFVAVVHVGDLSYAKGRTFVWDQFGALVEPVASRLPYMVAIGNHEYDYVSGGRGHDLSGSAIGATNGWHPPQGNFANDSKGECGVPAASRFHMPENGNKLFWYSFRVGLTHHVVLSSEHDCSAHSPMRAWLVHELTHNVNRTETPWLLVHLHRPLYCSEKFESDYGVSLLLRGCLERLLMEHHVDIVFSGHYHAYERTCPVYEQQCRQREQRNDRDSGEALAPTHIMIGSGGAELDDADYFDNANSTAWSVNHQQEYGYGRLHVYNASHAQFEFVRARDHEVTDDAWIVSRHDWEL